jgi:hypothetical protein
MLLLLPAFERSSLRVVVSSVETPCELLLLLRSSSGLSGVRRPLVLVLLLLRACRHASRRPASCIDALQ